MSVTERVVGLSVSGPGIPLEFVRFYNSQATNDGPPGYGWTHNYNLSVSELGDEVLVWTWNGRALSFERQGEAFRGRSGVKDLLEQEPTGGFVFTRKKTLWRYFFEEDGRLTSIEDLTGNSLNLIYEGDELKEVRSNFGKSLLFSYTGGRIERIEGPEENQILYDYEGGNLTWVSYPDGTNTTYLHEDPNDPHNMTGELDTEQNTVGFWAYDLRDRTFLAEEALGANQLRIQYDSLKNLVTDSLDHTKIFHYKIWDHIFLTSVSYGIGRLTGMVDPSGTYTYHYDAQGNLTTEAKLVDAVPYATHYGYDKNNTLTFMIYPSGRVVVYGLDDAGRVSWTVATLNEQPELLAYNMRYLPFGGITGLTYGNGISLVKRYDPRYRLVSILAVSDGVSLMSVTHGHGYNGNITAITNGSEPSRSQSFFYDPLNRLSHAQGIFGTITYTYDGVGNRETKTVKTETDV